MTRREWEITSEKSRVTSEVGYELMAVNERKRHLYIVFLGTKSNCNILLRNLAWCDTADT